ncbi:MAG: 3-deoxy-7-phosphoheptulonate synthase, partial [Rhodospirillaceae bacterium]|nr:3-deoxy-7-phosphoheptulonate synthase [Rhodospirillaceae bacterium]
MAATNPLTDWSPTSWQNRQASQQPLYRDPARLESAVAELSKLPPLVTSWEIEELKAKLAQAQQGRAFLLQGGDCAESFEECQSDIIVQKLKILLQMSLVLTAGLKKPVIRVGRMAGQYAKPRSANEEVRGGQSLPSFRGDLVNRNAFVAEDREPDPTLMLRGYERAALTLNFVRSLIDGGFADLHHPENWDLDFVRESAMAAEYHRLVKSVSDSIEFYELVVG